MKNFYSNFSVSQLSALFISLIVKSHAHVLLLNKPNYNPMLSLRNLDVSTTFHRKNKILQIVWMNETESSVIAYVITLCSDVSRNGVSQMLAQQSPVSYEFIYMVHFSNFGHWSYEVFERLLFIAFHVMSRHVISFFYTW